MSLQLSFSLLGLISLRGFLPVLFGLVELFLGGVVAVIIWFVVVDFLRCYYGCH